MPLNQGTTSPTSTTATLATHSTSRRHHLSNSFILYAGEDDTSSLKSAMNQESQDWSDDILEIDNERPGSTITHDMLLDEPYGKLCRAALAGHLRAVNCRTWSILRWFPKPGAPQPVRGRTPTETWGLPGLNPEEQLDTGNDSTLLLRFLLILVLAHEGAKKRPWPSSTSQPP